MKKLSLILALGLISTTSSAQHFGFRAQAYGSSFISLGCMSNGIKEAEENALEIAKVECGEKGFELKEETRVIESHRGSCWAGTPSGAVVAITFICN